MKKQLNKLSEKLYKREISPVKMVSITGGYTGTGCGLSLSTAGNEYECSDMDSSPIDTCTIN